MSKHSKAPWRVEPCAATHGEQTVLVDANGYVLARIESSAWNTDVKLKGAAKHDRANAIIMESAPALLKVLQDLVKTELFWGDHPKRIEAYSSARAIIDRLKGE